MWHRTCFFIRKMRPRGTKLQRTKEGILTKRTPREVVLWIAALAIPIFVACDPGASLSGDDASRGYDEQSYLRWVASLPRTNGGRLIIDGDLTATSDATLRDVYQRKMAGQGLGYSNRGDGEIGSSSSALTQYKPQVWPEFKKRNLTYCISDDFGADKSTVVNAIGAAARAWERYIDVNFVYQAAEDSDCTKHNYKVEFNVVPDCGDSSFSASAFFPHYLRKDRELLICNLSPVAPRSLAGVLKHELGHALGFFHEHSRLGSGSTCEKEPEGLTYLTTYDTGSVMHYLPGSSCKNKDSKYDYYLTPRDIAGAQGLYGKVSTRLVAFRTPKGTYLSSPVGSAAAAKGIFTNFAKFFKQAPKLQLLRADASSIGPLETFEIRRYPGNTGMMLRDHRGAFVSVGDSPGPVGVMANWGASGTLQLFPNMSGKYVLSGKSGLVLGENNDGTVEAHFGAANATKWTMVGLDEAPLALSSTPDGTIGGTPKYLSVKVGSVNVKRTNRLDRQSTFNLVTIKSGYLPFVKSVYAIRTHLHGYLSAEKVEKMGEADWKLTHGQSVVDGQNASSHFAVKQLSDGTIVFRSLLSKKYVCVGFAMTFVSCDLSDATRFGRVLLEGAKAMAIRTFGGGYLTGPALGGKVSTTAISVGPEEVFGLVDLGQNKVALRTSSGAVLSTAMAETVPLAPGAAVVSKHDWISPSESFTLIPLAFGSAMYHLLKTSNGDYLCPDFGPQGFLIAAGPSANAHCLFRLNEIPLTEN